MRLSNKMYLQMLAATLPMPYAVQPLAAMMEPAAVRTWVAIVDLKVGVRRVGWERVREVVAMEAEDHAIWRRKLVSQVSFILHLGFQFLDL